MYYLVVGAGRTEQILCTGTRAELEALAKKLRKGGFFRYVRIDSDRPTPATAHPSRTKKRQPGRGNGR